MIKMIIDEFGGSWPGRVPHHPNHCNHYLLPFSRNTETTKIWIMIKVIIDDFAGSRAG
jgi:hypothetical protein